MDPGRRVRREGLSVAWSRQAEGVLWRIVPDHEGGLIGEERDQATRSASFLRVHVASGEVAWKDVAAPGGWWTGIEYVTHGALLLHGFASPDLPGHRGVTALDLHTGAVLWSDDAVVFVAVADGVVYGLRTRSEGRELIGRGLLTGAVIIEEPADEARLQHIAAQWQADIPPSFSLPEPLEAGSVEHTLAHTLLAGGSLVENAVEMLRVDEMTVTAHHERLPEGTPGRPLFRRILSVFGGQVTTPVYRDILDDSLTVPLPEAFFVVGRTLLFVKNRRTLCALHLSDGPGKG